MPTYEYGCSSCDTTHEIVQSMSDPTLTDCPACGEPTLKKRFNGVGVVFKGSGFYRTDSRSGSSGSSGNSGSSGSTATSGSSSSTTTSSSGSSTTSSTSSTSSSSSSTAS